MHRKLIAIMVSLVLFSSVATVVVLLSEGTPQVSAKGKSGGNNGVSKPLLNNKEPSDKSAQLNIPPSAAPNAAANLAAPNAAIDCKTDTSCVKPILPVDCIANPTDPSCVKPLSVDCKAYPNDPSCVKSIIHLDCKAYPNDPSCVKPILPVDCKAYPNDPSCVGTICGMGFHAEADKCVPDPVTCDSGTHLSNGICTPDQRENKNVIRNHEGGGSAVGGGNNNSPQNVPKGFLLYENQRYGITIQYPSKWTKLELGGRVPVMFNAPMPNASVKSTFLISVDNLTSPQTTTLDGYTAQQVYGLTHSNTKYNVINSIVSVLVPPGGASATGMQAHQITFNGNKTINDTTNAVSQVPVDGAGIFLVNGDKGYSLLYLANETEYSKNLPTIQQMVSSFQIGGSQSTATGVHNINNQGIHQSKNGGGGGCPTPGPGGCNGAFSQGPGPFSPLNPNFGQTPLQQNIPEFDPNNP